MPRVTMRGVWGGIVPCWVFSEAAKSGVLCACLSKREQEEEQREEKILKYEDVEARNGASEE